jgi:hypothetical protein
MTQYIIVPNGDGSGFNVSVAGADGTRQTLLGFGSEAEAEAWITRDKRLDGANAAAADRNMQAGTSD